MKQNLIDIGQKITNLINAKLQEDQLSKDEYLSLLYKIELIINKESKIVTGEIIEIDTKSN